MVALSAGATVVLIKGEIKTIAKDLHFHKAIKLSSGVLAPAGFGLGLGEVVGQLV